MTWVQRPEEAAEPYGVQAAPVRSPVPEERQPGAHVGQRGRFWCREQDPRRHRAVAEHGLGVGRQEGAGADDQQADHDVQNDTIAIHPVEPGRFVVIQNAVHNERTDYTGN